MSAKGLFQIIAFALLASSAVCLSLAKIQEFERTALANNLCQTAGNFLETGALRDAYEAIQAGLTRSGYPNACVAVIDNGRSYANNCLDSKVAYETDICRAVGNIGVRAEVHFPVMPWITSTFLLLWAFLFAAVLGTIFIYRRFARKLLGDLSVEFKSRLLDGEITKPRAGRLARLVDRFLKKTGVAQEVRSHVNRFEAQLRSFEARIRDEEALRARQELEAERSKQHIEKVKQIRHDLCSPLSSLLALQERIAKDGSEAAALSGVIRRIKLLVDDLEDVNRVSEEPRLTIVEVVASEAVSSVRQKFFQAKGISVSLDYNPKRLSPVYAVPERLTGIFENLLENAFDAASHRGKITVNIRTDGSACQLTVEDDGVGIPAGALGKLFTRGGTYRKVNGTGLGLFHAKETLRSWNGDICCEPLVGGTRFTVSIPLVQAGVTFIGPNSLKEAVLIDDDPTVERALSATGLRILASARTLESGRNLLRSPRPVGSAVLVDYHLGIDQFGTDLIEEQTDRRSVIICSGDFDDSVLLKKARHLGVPVLPKPLCFFGRERVLGSHLGVAFIKDPDAKQETSR